MIQRIQSLWLLLATAAILLVFKFPIASAAAATAGAEAKGFFASSNLPLFVIAILLALSSFLTIFLFRRRSKQKRFIWLSILVSFLFITLMYFPAQDFIDQTSGKFSIGAMSPVLYIIFMALAFAGIRSDEKLIKSTNRLR
jgi:glucan phosphoethanolaminetransferase (alkaline phosphatase superfamily)